MPNGHEIYQNGRKIHIQKVIKYTNIVHSKALQNIPKLGFLAYIKINHLATLEQNVRSVGCRVTR
jgi:hypothetical protein